MSDPGDELIGGTIDVLANTPQVLRALLGTLPDAVTERPADDGWSPRDVVAHMLSVDPWGLADRARQLLDADDPAIASFDSDAAFEQSGYRAQPVGWLLDEFERIRTANVGWLRTLGRDAWARSGRHADVGVITVANVVHHISFHDLSHIQQIAAMLGSTYHAGRGNMADAY